MAKLQFEYFGDLEDCTLEVRDGSSVEEGDPLKDHPVTLQVCWGSKGQRTGFLSLTIEEAGKLERDLGRMIKRIVLDEMARNEAPEALLFSAEAFLDRYPKVSFPGGWTAKDVDDARYSRLAVVDDRMAGTKTPILVIDNGLHYETYLYGPFGDSGEETETWMDVSSTIDATIHPSWLRRIYDSLVAEIKRFK